MTLQWSSELRYLGPSKGMRSYVTRLKLHATNGNTSFHSSNSSNNSCCCTTVVSKSSCSIVVGMVPNLIQKSAFLWGISIAPSRLFFQKNCAFLSTKRQVHKLNIYSKKNSFTIALEEWNRIYIAWSMWSTFFLLRITSYLPEWNFRQKCD